VALSKHCRHPRDRWRRCGCSWYWDGRIEGRRQYRNLGTADRDEARRVAARIEADRLDGRIVPTRRNARLAEVAERWLDHLAALNRRPQTLRAYRTAANVVESYFGPDADVRRIDAAAVEKFERDAWASRRGNGPRALMAGLRGILQQAKRDHLIEVVPQGTGDRRSVPPNPDVRMSEAESDATIAELRPVHWRVLAEFIVLTGLRIGECLALRWDDLDAERGTLHVRANAEQRGDLRAPTKTRTSSRQFRLDPAAVALLAGLARDDRRIFPYRYAAALSALNRAMDRAGTNRPQRGWHSLRHTNTALRGRAGQSIRDAAAELGHGPHFAMTAAYGWADESAEATRVSEVRQRHDPPSGS
jgi:integrase